MSAVHDFNERLEYSHSHSDSSWWIDVYKKAFPTFLTAVDIRKDGWMQRSGVDRLVILESGKQVCVDEKVRSKKYYDVHPEGDIFLETWSKKESQVRGWIAKDLQTDFIAYAFENTKECYLMPFQNMRKAYLENRFSWCRRYGKRQTRTKTRCKRGFYTTEGIPVPIPVLLEEIKNSMVVKWA